jgi:hypothetical protein
MQWNTSLQLQDKSKKFREVIMVAGWTIRCYCNAIIFDGASFSLGRRKQAFKDEFALIIHKAKPSIKSPLKSWLSRLFFFFI